MSCLGNYKYEINDKSVVNKETCLYPKRHISKVAHCLYESMKCSYSVNPKTKPFNTFSFNFVITAYVIARSLSCLHVYDEYTCMII